MLVRRKIPVDQKHMWGKNWYLLEELDGTNCIFNQIEKCLGLHGPNKKRHFIGERYDKT